MVNVRSVVRRLRTLSLDDVRRQTKYCIASLVVVACNPVAAQAIPVFANGGGVSCQTCHNAPPNLNAYGRYILGTNFVRGLNAHQQMQESLRDPFSIEVDGNGSNSNPSNTPNVAGSGRFLGGGYLGQTVSYYASVPVISRGFPTAAVDQVWAAYNGFSAGNASVQVGKFPTPVFAPWLSQSLSLAGYSLAAMPVGLNTVGLGDNRWGASYTQIGRSGLIGTAAYVTNSGPIEGAYRNVFGDSGEGQSFVGSLQFLAPAAHVTGGFATIAGTSPLPSGSRDRFTREMALLSYSTSTFYSINAMALIGQDNNPLDGAGSSGSNGVSLEAIVNPNSWLHLDGRFERTNDGLGLQQNNYVTDVAFNPIPNLILTLENVSSVGQRPVMGYQLTWAGPWIRRPFPGAAAAPVMRAVAPVASAIAASSDSGAPLYATNCAACHAAGGQGGVGPDLRGIAGRLTLSATIAKIEQPSGAMPKLYPSVLSAEQVSAVATYVRTAFR